MKKLFTLTALFFLSACTQAIPSGQQSSSSSSVESSIATSSSSSAPAALQTYHNGTYGFQVSYPSDFVFVTPAYANLQDKIMQIQTQRDAYPGTNFGDAAVTISAAYAKSQADCLSMSLPEGSDGFRTQTTVDAIPFFLTQGTGAGAGNIYDTTAYRTFAGNQTCIEISETIHTSNIGNYTPGTVTAVDKAAVQEQLDAIVRSFIFAI